MGFLDDLKKAADGLADGINKAVNSSSVGAGGQAPPPPGATPPPPPGATTPPPPPGAVAGAAAGGDRAPAAPMPLPAVPDDWYLDATRPEAWLAPERVTLRIGSVLGVAPAPGFDPPQRFARDGLEVARYSSHDGAYTVDVASYTEDLMASLGSQQAIIDAARPGLPTSEPAGGEFDVGLRGSQGPGHGAFVACLADTAGRVDVYGPPHDALPVLAHALLVDAWRMND